MKSKYDLVPFSKIAPYARKWGTSEMTLRRLLIRENVAMKVSRELLVDIVRLADFLDGVRWRASHETLWNMCHDMVLDMRVFLPKVRDERFPNFFERRMKEENPVAFAELERRTEAYLTSDRSVSCCPDLRYFEYEEDAQEWPASLAIRMVLEWVKRLGE